MFFPVVVFSSFSFALKMTEVAQGLGHQAKERYESV